MVDNTRGDPGRVDEQAKQVTDEGYQSRRRVFVREVSGAYSEIYKRLSGQQRVFSARDASFRGGPQHWVKAVVNPGRVEVSQLFECHIDVYAPGAYGQRHAHMNGAMFYILDGEGYDVHDGERYDWKAGDVCIVEPGCVHQHFNASKTEPARMLIMKSKPLYIFSNFIHQRTVRPEPTDPVPGYEHFEPDFAQIGADEPARLESAGGGA